MALTVAQLQPHEITVTATGGTGTITYSKDNGTTSSFKCVSGLAAGTYQIKVKMLIRCLRLLL
jgi:hypothetical protein